MINLRGAEIYSFHGRDAALEMQTPPPSPKPQEQPKDKTPTIGDPPATEAPIKAPGANS